MFFSESAVLLVLAGHIWDEHRKLYRKKGQQFWNVTVRFVFWRIFKRQLEAHVFLMGDLSSMTRSLFFLNLLLRQHWNFTRKEWDLKYQTMDSWGENLGTQVKNDGFS